PEASSLCGPQLDPKGRMESHVKAWFDENTWIGAEDPIITDEEVEERTLSNMIFGDMMAYKSYVIEKRQ
ncbi:hypothetical protein Tco_1258831, partial [Tanacetum coccineum]